MTEYFSKILVARHSPKNGCYADEGTVLFVKPLAKIRIKDHIPHYFLSTQDRKTRSKYGWVKETDPFTLDDFIIRHLSEVQLSEDDRMHLETMLRSIAGMPNEVPVAATYSSRGLEEKRMEFTVHRVFFYEA